MSQFHRCFDIHFTLKVVDTKIFIEACEGEDHAEADDAYAVDGPNSPIEVFTGES